MKSLWTSQITWTAPVFFSFYSSSSSLSLSLIHCTKKPAEKMRLHNYLLLSMIYRASSMNEKKYNQFQSESVWLWLICVKQQQAAAAAAEIAPFLVLILKSTNTTPYRYLNCPQKSERHPVLSHFLSFSHSNRLWLYPVLCHTTSCLMPHAISNTHAMPPKRYYGYLSKWMLNRMYPFANCGAGILRQPYIRT